MEEKDSLLVEQNEEIMDFLHDRGFSCEVIENHGIIASFGNSALLLSPRADGCFAAKATTLSRDEVLAMYKADTKDSRLESNRQIGWWAYENDNLPRSGLLHIDNHDHNIYEIRSSVDDMLKNNLRLINEVTQNGKYYGLKVNLDQTEWNYKGVKGEIHYANSEHSEDRRLISPNGVALYPDEFSIVLKDIDHNRAIKHMNMLKERFHSSSKTIDILSQVSDLKSQGTGIAESNAKIEGAKQSEIAQHQKHTQGFSGR